MNMDEISIDADERGKSFCLQIAHEMTRIFGIPISESIGRINQHWKGQKIEGSNMIYQRDPQWWAKTIYYDAGVYWWLDWWMAEHTPKPKPYP